MRFTTLLLLLISFGARAQQAEPILFGEKVHDFGEINEEGGSVNYEFGFTNNSGRPIRILTVQASCGCTTPGWSKEVILPGKPGFIKASFDPKGRPGYFNKSLTVTTDLDRNSISLQIKGQVVGRNREVKPTDFPVESGSLRLKFNSFHLGKVFINREPVEKNFAIRNAGNKPVNFTGKINGPAYIKVETPKSLAPDEQGTIKIIYDGKARNQYGFVSDNIEIETDDNVLPAKSFTVFATLEEYFAPLSSDELSKAAVLRMDVSAIDFGRIKEGTILVREVAVRNDGKKDLTIRSLQGNCSCVTGSVESTTLKPGAETKLKIAFATQGRTGIQQKAITIYSNDPRNPVQRVTLSGFVEN